MHKTILGKPHAWLISTPKRLSRLIGTGLLLLASLGAQAQTATTVFSEDFEGTTSGFTTVNGTQTNQWVVGTAAGNGPTATTGTRAAYVSNDAGVTNAYTLNSATVAHLYRDVTLPAGQTAIQLGFDWRGVGESTYDYLLVQVAPTTFTPVAGTLPAATSVTVLAQINLQAAFTRTTLIIPPSLAGTTQRLIFTWRNDNLLGAQPPAAIDNVTLTARAAAPLTGAYTINSAAPTAGTNFASFTDAAARLNLDGVGGPVTLTVTGGPYTEQFLLNQLPGSSPTNTLTVNGTGSTIRFASTNSNLRAVVQLNGTDYTTINNLVIDATGGAGATATYGYGVLLTNGADNDRIANNTITTNTTGTFDYFTGIAVSGVTYSPVTSGNSANSLIVEGNTVTGGLYGITLFGNNATALNTGNIVRNNTIRDTYGYGISTAYQDGARIIGNDIARPLRTNSGTFYGMYVQNSSRGMAIEKNRIHDLFTAIPANTSTFYGIYLLTGTGATPAAPNDVVNNVFYNLNGSGAQYLIYNSGSANCRIYNNTLSSDDQTTATTLSTQGIYNSGTPCDIRNNVVRITRTGTGTKYGLYYTQTPTTSNYNDIHVPTGNVSYFSGAFATLADWQATFGNFFDQNSRSVDPAFVGASTGNLLPTSAVLNSAGTPLARVTDDITGAPRGAVPDPGAYEFAPIAIDVVPVSLISPAASAACFGAAESLSVQFSNAGAAPLNLATNPVTITAAVSRYTTAVQTLTTTLNTGTLAPGATQTVVLPGTLDMSLFGVYAFAVTAAATGDANPSNDSFTTYRLASGVTAGALSPAAYPICTSGTATLTLASATGGNLQFQSGPSATGPFTDIAGATSATYTTPVLTSTTYYRVRVNCATTVYSNVATISVSNPLVATTNSPLGVCVGSSATLTASASTGSMIRFFSTATGGTALAMTTAGTYTTPALTTNTTYYAEAYTSGAENVGATAQNSPGQLPTTAAGLYFSTTQATTIANVTVYLNAGQAAGTVTIELRAGLPTGAVVNGQNLTFAVPAGPVTGTAPYIIPLNYLVPAAGQYVLYLASATQGGLLRDNTGANISYPYSTPSGIVSITSSTAAGYYYYFYNWQVGSDCVNTTRTPIQVTVSPIPTTPTLTATIQPNGAVLLTASPVTGATYQFYRGSATVGTPSTSNTLLLQSGTLNGSYTVVVLAGGCPSAQSAAVAVTVTATRATASLNGVSLLVYPNPTPDGQLTLELTGPQAKASQLEVLNSLGQVVRRRVLVPGVASLSLAELVSGVYTLRVQVEQGILTQRIVRE